MPIRRVLHLIAAVALLVFLFALGACKRPAGDGGSGSSSPPGAGSPAASGPPCMMLVTIDTWRWDYVGASGSGKVATKALDRLAGEGVYEPEAETPYPMTTPSHATVLTGLLPMRHRILDNFGYTLPKDVPTLAEAFQAKGYSTAAFISSLTLASSYGLGRGFATYDQGGIGEGGGSGPGTTTRDGALTTEAVLGYLRGQAPGSPQFLWVHYFDLHTPYRPHPAYDALYPGNPYAAEAAFVDDQVGALLGYLRSDGSRRWRVLVVGDHGEGLGDRGEISHGLGLYRSTLHVPLIVWPKPERPLLHAKPWRLEDLDATLREWFGLPKNPKADGESLFAAGSKERLLPSMTVLPSSQYGVNPCLGVRKGGLMYIRHGIEELFDTAADPDEGRNLGADPGRRADLEALRAACDETFPADELQSAATPNAQASEAELEGLRGLGYLGGFAPRFSNLQRADIRQVFADDGRLRRAEAAYHQNRDPKPMAQAYEAILARYPNAVLFYRMYGVFLMQQGDREAALRAFERAVKFDPKDRMSLMNLGGLYLEKGKAREAGVLLESALALKEDDPLAHKNLGILYSQYLNNPAKAVSHFNRYLELAPNAPDQQAVRDYIRQVEGR